MKTKSGKSIDAEFSTLLATDKNWAKRDEIFYRWNDGCWEAMATNAMQKIAYDYLKKHYFAEATAKRAQNLVAAALLDCNPLPDSGKRNIIPMMDCYLEISGGEVNAFPPDPALGMTYVVKASVGKQKGKYQPSSLPLDSLFNRFLQKSLPCLDVRELVQEYIGYSLLSTTSFQVAQLWLGEGRNGKSVGLDIVSALHGRTVAMRLDHLQGFALQSLIGASLAVVSEAPRSNVDSEAVKAVIAGDTVQIDRKYQEPVNYKPTAKWLMAANHTPRTHDHSDGWWRRFQIIPWSVQIEENEVIPDLAEQVISKELHLVLDWALEGVVRLLQRRRFNTNAATLVQARKNAMEETNPVVAWAEEVCPVAHEIGMPKQEVYAAFRAWALDNGYQSPASNEFWKRMKNHFKGRFQLDKRFQVTVNNLERVEYVRMLFGKALRDENIAFEDGVPAMIFPNHSEARPAMH